MGSKKFTKVVAKKYGDRGITRSASLATMYSVQRLRCTHDACDDRKNKEQPGRQASRIEPLATSNFKITCRRYCKAD